MFRFLIIIVSVVGAAYLFFSYETKTPLSNRTAADTVAAVIDSAAGAPAGQAPELILQTPANPFWQQVLTDYSHYVQNAINQHQAPGAAVAIVSDSSILFANGFGYRDYANQDPVDLHSVFRLGSVSKSVSATLTGLLVQDGILKWSDKVVDYLPNFRLKSKAFTDSLTIGHLLSHTTGLPYHAFTDRVDAGVDFDTLVYHLRDLDLIGPPGKVYSYQNVAYSIVASVIEKATGHTFEQTMEERLFTPLGMQNASLTFAEMASTLNKARPHQHASEKGWRPLPISYTYYNVGPAGGVNASIRDMALWLRSLTNPMDTTFNAQTKSEFFQPTVKAIARNRNFRMWKRSKGSYYAKGWRVLTFKDDTLNYHGGYVNGFRSEVAIKRDDRVGIVVLVNCAGALADHAVPEFFRIYDRYREQILKWDREHPTHLLAQSK